MPLHVAGTGSLACLSGGGRRPSCPHAAPAEPLMSHLVQLSAASRCLPPSASIHLTCARSQQVFQTQPSSSCAMGAAKSRIRQEAGGSFKARAPAKAAKSPPCRLGQSVAPAASAAAAPAAAGCQRWPHSLPARRWYSHLTARRLRCIQCSPRRMRKLFCVAALNRLGLGRNACCWCAASAHMPCLLPDPAGWKASAEPNDHASLSQLVQELQDCVLSQTEQRSHLEGSCLVKTGPAINSQKRLQLKTMPIGPQCWA